MLGAYLFITVMSFLMNCPFYHCITSIFVSCYLFWLELYFVFFWLPFVRGVYHLSSLHLEFMSLELRLVSQKQLIVGSCFLNHPATVPFDQCLVHLHLGWVLIYEGSLLPFYLLFSGRLETSFLPAPCVSPWLFILVVFCDIFSQFPFFKVLCLNSGVLFCGYNEICIKYLIDEIVLFLPITPFLLK